MSFLGDLFGGGPKPPAALPAPKPEDATAKAAAVVADQRAAMLASGGQTDFTGGLGLLVGSDINSKSGMGI